MNGSTHGTKGWVDPITRPLTMAAIPSAGLDVTVTLDTAERVAMAKALGLSAVDEVIATYNISHGPKKMVVIAGELKALVQPVCGVSLEPFPFRIREKVGIKFSDDVREPVLEEDLSSSEDPPELIENDMIDLGKVTTEFLALALPQFPRKPGASFVAPDEAVVESPFAALTKLKAVKP